MLERQEFGRFKGAPVSMVTLANASGMRAEILDWGATLRSLSIPMGSLSIPMGSLSNPMGSPSDLMEDQRRELVLGFDSFDDYPALSPYFGATAGRFGNRIANGRLELDGSVYQLDINENGRTHLHGGADGLSMRIWATETDPSGNAVTFSIHSPDGDQGYPGAVDARCRYELTDESTLLIEMTATASRPTPVNLIHHSYWNLDGSGVIDGHTLDVSADSMLPTDEAQIPTGEIRPVAGTDFDFRKPRPLDAKGEPIIDFAFVLPPATGIRRVAELISSDGRCRMALHTDQPALQVYTGFKMDFRASNGRHFPPRSGICLETQAFPDAPNHPDFPSAILRPGETYRHRMEHRFSWS